MDPQKFFDPRSVAIIGASQDPAKVGHALLQNVLAGKERAVYPVNLKEKEILGKICYPSVGAIPGEVDLALISVPAGLVAGVLKECGEKHIPNVVVISAGFKEIGEQGKALEEELVRIAREYGIALLGPNCFGFADAVSQLNTTFAADSPIRGNIAFISQSGALGAVMLNWANTTGVGLSKFVSLGNEAVLTELDLLDVLKDDVDTEAVLVYIEKVSDGPRFLRTVGELTAKKPVVILKSGRSARGSKAAQSHTGSLAPEDSIFKTACRQSGAIVVDSLHEFFYLAKLFHIGVLRPAPRVAILTNAGGPAIVTADLVEFSNSLTLAELSEDTKNKLRAVLPQMASVLNPVDIIGDALASRYKDALEVLVSDPDIDAILLVLTPQTMTEPEATAEAIIEYQKRKPILPIFIGGKGVEKGRELLMRSGSINFDFPDDAVRALDSLAVGRASKAPAAKPASGTEGTLTMMDFDATHALLDSYGLQVAGRFVRTKEELEGVIGDMRMPLALKVFTPDVVHKTDAKGLQLNLRTRDEVFHAWDIIATDIAEKRPGAVIEGFLVQEMTEGKEIIIGMKRDAVFGPVVVFGYGGVFVEVLKDASMGLPPIDERLAREMIESIKAFPILNGLRGATAVNIDALVQLLMVMGRLSIEHPEIEEFDLNPVIVNEERAEVIDARFMRKREGN